MNDVRERMQETARAVESILPPGTGFIVLAFDTETSNGQLEYVANGERDSVLLLMREFIAKAEHTWGQHVKGLERCPTCGQRFGSNQ